jgi:hypothetical protein
MRFHPNFLSNRTTSQISRLQPSGFHASSLSSGEISCLASINGWQSTSLMWWLGLNMSQPLASPLSDGPYLPDSLYNDLELPWFNSCDCSQNSKGNDHDSTILYQGSLSARHLGFCTISSTLFLLSFSFFLCALLHTFSMVGIDGN